MQENLAFKEDLYFNYSYGRYFSNGVLVLSTILLLLGIKLCLYGMDIKSPLALLGLIFILIGIASYIPTELLQINYHTKEYRVAVKVFSHLYGEWETMGDVKYLSIVNINKSIALSSSEDGRKNKHDIIQECRLRLFKRPGYTIDIDDYKSRTSAIEIGRIISEGLTLPLLDATSKPPTFI